MVTFTQAETTERHRIRRIVRPPKHPCEALPDAMRATEVPLFWLKQAGTIPGPDVPTKRLVESKYAKDGAVLIVSLRFNHREWAGGK
jgi:hypothetical protein